MARGRSSLLALLATAAIPLARPAWSQEGAAPTPAGTREGSPTDPDDAAGSPTEPEATPPAADTQPQEAADVQPPRLLSSGRAERPAGLEGSPVVVLTLSIDETGLPSEPVVVRSAGPLADQAALQAVLGWKFSPAKQGEKPVAVRTALEVTFEAEATNTKGPPETPALPAASPNEATASAHTTAAAPLPGNGHDHSGPDATDSHLEVTVHGTRAARRERRGASDYLLHSEVLKAAPRREGADVLSAAPGLYVGRSEGMAVAHSLSLRGFDAAHGQDIAISVGGLPINLPSHIHGQGYADLGFLIAESVDQVVVKEGVRDPSQGDFAVAGSIDLSLGVDAEHRGLELRSALGSWDTFSQKVLWAPKNSHRESLGAAELRTTSGFGDNRAGQAASGVVQHRFGKGPVTFRALGFAYGASGASAGVVRRDDVEAGTVCFTCAYEDPTARAQGTLAQRVMAGLFADYAGPEHANGTLGVWAGKDHFRGKSNFTGYVERSDLLPSVSGRGDLFEQVGDTTSLGITGRYRTGAFEPAPSTHGTIEVGLDGRLDAIEQSQNLIDASVRNQIWDRRIDASISQGEVSLWADLDWQFASTLSARIGGRASVMSFEVLDRLANLPSRDRPNDSFLPGYRRHALGTFVGPRTSIEWKPLDQLSLLASYGEGYRSPQARTLDEGDQTPFARSRSVDLGSRLRLGDPLELSIAAFLTHMDDDVAFDPTVGSLERIGPTSRLGASAYAASHLGDRLVATFSATYVHATLLDAPPPTAEDPVPPFQEGQLLPYVAPLTLRLDARATQPLLDLSGRPLTLELKTGFTYLSPRPLPYDDWAPDVGLLDASLALLWGPIDLGISGFNLLNIQYESESFAVVSNWDAASPPSRIPAHHLAAGPPVSFLIHLGLHL